MTPTYEAYYLLIFSGNLYFDSSTLLLTQFYP